MAQCKNDMLSPSGMEKLIVGIEQINPAMPLRGNAWGVEEGQGDDLVQERIN